MKRGLLIVGRVAMVVRGALRSSRVRVLGAVMGARVMGQDKSLLWARAGEGLGMWRDYVGYDLCRICPVSISVGSGVSDGYVYTP